MRIKTLQWNIGGGRVRDKESDPNEMASYSIVDLPYIIDIIKKFSPDIVTLQEVHSSREIDQGALIAKAVGMKDFVSNVYDSSHLEEGLDLGQAILSRFPFKGHDFVFFFNPKLELTRPDGTKWIMHNKGVSTCLADLPDGKTLEIKTLHMMPFRKFKIDPLSPKWAHLRADLNEKLKIQGENALVQADFNFDELKVEPLLSDIFEKGVKEIPTKSPTTPKGRRYDHVIYKGLKLKSSKIISNVLTDHYPIISEFEL